MFPAWRLKLREAKLALKEGRLDEAGRLLEGELGEYLPGKKLSEKVAQRIANRARQRIAAGESSAGWHDLELAERLAEGTSDVAAVRESLISKGIADVQAALAAGEPQLAMSQLAKMERRGRLTSVGRQWKEVARLLLAAHEAAARGHFGEAVASMRSADSSLPAERASGVDSHLKSQVQQLTENAEKFRQLSQDLHEALGAQQWPKVLATAEAMLVLAPAGTIAQDARRQAWEAVGMKTTQVHTREPARRPMPKSRHRAAAQSTRGSIASGKVDTVTERTPAERLLLWVDGIGGFLVIHGEEIVIGQPAGQSDLDLPIQADLSRRHAIIRRDGGAYLLDPLQETRIDGRRIDGPVVLANNNLIQLGENVTLRFKKPHVLSATAVLDIESNHKTQPRADGVVLMADTLVLGPKSHSHIRCREWANDVILFRRGEGLLVRTMGTLNIDGEELDQHGPVAVGSQVEGEDFSLSLEAV
jgi:hypothetical protein